MSRKLFYLLITFSVFSGKVFSQSTCPEGSNTPLSAIHIVTIFENGILMKNLLPINEPLNYCQQIPNSVVSVAFGSGAPIFLAGGEGLVTDLFTAAIVTSTFTKNSDHAATVSFTSVQNKSYNVVVAYSNVAANLVICPCGYPDLPDANWVPTAVTSPFNCDVNNIMIPTSNVPSGISNIEFYWSNSSTSFLYDSFHKLEPGQKRNYISGDPNFTVHNPFYVRAIVKNSQGIISWYSPVSSAIPNIPVGNPPTQPVFLGPKYVCENNTDLVNFSAQIPGSPTGAIINWYSSADLQTPLTSSSFVPEKGVQYYISSAWSEGDCESDLVPIDLLWKEADCVDGFNPVIGEKYVVQAWVSTGNINNNNFDDGVLYVNFLDANGNTSSSQMFKANLNTVEGWKRLEHTFNVPSGAVAFKVSFGNQGTGSIYFDDVRIFRAEGEMVSYVYNQETMQLEYELDKNNFYKKYIRNEGGEVTTVNIETVDGVRSVTETRNHVQK